MKKIILFILIVSSGIFAADSGDQLKAIIIGSGSPTYNENRSGPSVLITGGDTKILVDMGNGTQANLDKSGVEPRDLSALLFTHHHLDHNEEFVPLFIRLLMGRNDFQVIGPPNTVELAEANLILYEEDINYRLGKTNRSIKNRKRAMEVKNIEGGESFAIGDIEISTLEVPHTIHTIAYRFDYKGSSVVVTGDLTYTEDLSALARDADFMIIDSGGMIKKRRKNNSTENTQAQNRKRRPSSEERAHVTLAESSLMGKEANVKNLVYTHFGTGNIDEKASLEEIRKNYQGNVIFGEDLMELNSSQ